MDGIVVHERIQERHPSIRKADVAHAWKHCLRSAPRVDRAIGEHVAIGADAQGRLLEMVAIRLDNGDWLIYHAMTPPSKRTLIELDFAIGGNYEAYRSRRHGTY